MKEGYKSHKSVMIMIKSSIKGINVEYGKGKAEQIMLKYGNKKL